MRIGLLVPGSGGTFYCQNCLRDYSLVRELRRQGHDAIMMPLYLPPFGDDADTARETPIFFGGVNAYLQQRIPLFRKTPRWLDKLFDAPWVLKQAAARAGSTSAAGLGPMTLSMLQGREGNQRKEFDRLLTWLREQERPEVIHVSNALLLGFASEIKETLGVPIVCSLQDEEPWIEAMAAPYNQMCWKTMSENARRVDQFIAVSAWYADRMSARMNIPRDRITVVFPGIETEGVVRAERGSGPRMLGFLSRLSESLGFGAVVDAFIELKKDPLLNDLRLRATGGQTAADRGFIDSMVAKVSEAGFEDSLDILPDFQRAERNAFLRSLTILSVPVPEGEAFGVELIEAMACGVPVVQPRVGAYPEIIEATRGGILYDPGEPGALVRALRELLCDPERAEAFGERGRAVVLERFTVERMARETLAVYAGVREKSRAEG